MRKSCSLFLLILLLTSCNNFSSKENLTHIKASEVAVNDTIKDETINNKSHSTDYKENKLIEKQAEKEIETPKETILSENFSKEIRHWSNRDIQEAYNEMLVYVATNADNLTQSETENWKALVAEAKRRQLSTF